MNRERAYIRADHAGRIMTEGENDSIFCWAVADWGCCRFRRASSDVLEIDGDMRPPALGRSWRAGRVVPHDPPFPCLPSASNGNLTLVRGPLTAEAREEVRELLMQRVRKVVKLRARE